MDRCCSLVGRRRRRRLCGCSGGSGSSGEDPSDAWHANAQRLFNATSTALQRVRSLNNFREHNNSVGGRDRTKSITGVMVSGVTSRHAATVNGFYAEAQIPGYHGARTYRKLGTDLAVYRWQHRYWLIGDLGEQLRSIGLDSEHGRTHTYCRIAAGSDLPPEEGWVEGNGSSSSSSSTGGGGGGSGGGGSSTTGAVSVGSASGSGSDGSPANASAGGGNGTGIRVVPGTLRMQPSSPAIWQWCDESTGACARLCVCAFVRLCVCACTRAGPCRVRVCAQAREVWCAVLRARFGCLVVLTYVRNKHWFSFRF